MRDKEHPEDMTRIVEAYAQVLENLNAHVHPDNAYPDAEYLKSVIKGGPAVRRCVRASRFLRELNC